MGFKLRHWTFEEDQMLISHYPTGSTSELAQKLGRTAKAVQLRAFYLGVKKRYVLKELKLTETQYAYLAGLIDGDGSIIIDSFRNIYKPLIRITSTSLDGIRILDKMLKGFTSKIISRDIRSSSKPVHVLTIGGIPRVWAVLEKLLPYLIIRKKQAELVSLFCLLRIAKGKGANYTKDEVELVKRVRELNERGRGA